MIDVHCQVRIGPHHNIQHTGGITWIAAANEEALSSRRLVASETGIVSWTVHVVIIAATEMVIFWNRISEVQGIDSVGQLIPFIIGRLCFRSSTLGGEPYGRGRVPIKTIDMSQSDKETCHLV